jgi:hypothetical protein
MSRQLDIDGTFDAGRDSSAARGLDGGGGGGPTAFWFALDRVEALLGLIFASFVFVIGGFGSLLQMLMSRHDTVEERVWKFSAWGAFVVAAAATLRFYGRGFSDAGHPMAVDLAMSQPRYPWPLRPFVAAWWLACFAIVPLAGKWTTGQFSLIPGMGLQAWGWKAAALAVLFAAAHAANTYLMLAVATLVRRRPLVRVLWGLRLAVDALVVLALAKVDLSKTYWM